MRQFMPSLFEVGIFAVLSIGLALSLSFVDTSVHDLGLSFCALPLFVFSAVLGLRRHWARNEAAAQTVEVMAERPADGMAD